ncbi:MAG: C39 family peptidase [Anaerolineae bacterium]
MSWKVRRRSPPLAIWVLLGLLAGVVGLGVVFGLIAWQKTAQVQTLQAELAVLRNERQAMEAQVASLQSAVTLCQDRLAALEANDPAQQLASIQQALTTVRDPHGLSNLQASLSEIQTKIDQLQETLNDLARQMESIETTQQEPIEAIMEQSHLDVPRQRQSHNLSCEASAASMVAQYHGVNLSEADVLAALPANQNPHLGFRGNVDGPTGGIQDYGVYAGPILAILNSRGLRAWLVEGGLDGIKAAIHRGNPVIAWVTYHCLPSTPVIEEIDGKQVTLVPNQHVVVVTGYNADGVWANDPWDGQEDFYPTEDFVRAMSYFGDMAVEVAKP